MTPAAIPDPRAVYEREGEAELRERLEPLQRDELEEVVRAFPAHHTSPPALHTLSDAELRDYILDGAVRAAG